jgi:hypothetical protein
MGRQDYRRLISLMARNRQGNRPRERADGEYVKAIWGRTPDIEILFQELSRNALSNFP